MRPEVHSPLHAARIARTRLLKLHPQVYFSRLHREIINATGWARKIRLKLAIRLNGTSDIDWSPVAKRHPDVVFYDYTKDVGRALRALTDPSWPENYDLTLSRSEVNWRGCVDVLASGGRVAVVAKDYEDVLSLGEWAGHRLYDGVGDDLRFLEGPGITLLKPLGSAQKLAASATLSGPSFVVAAEAWEVS